jgi:hypothetical protein
MDTKELQQCRHLVVESETDAGHLVDTKAAMRRPAFLSNDSLVRLHHILLSNASVSYNGLSR